MNIVNEYMLAGALSSFPNSVFAQNNGMIQLTGVASRYVGYYIAAFRLISCAALARAHYAREKPSKYDFFDTLIRLF